ncbi:MAG: energy transducer TonB [Gammaproteobacteria bacterium]|nr:energy transducer TonB [Gammaproteobacteria bacterium]
MAESVITLTAPPIDPGDRLSFTVFLALALHAAIIMGVTFTMTEKGPSTHTMEVTLAQHRTKNKPDKADFLAQFNQIGSGTLQQKALTTTESISDFRDTVIRKTIAEQQQAMAPPKLQQQQVVASITKSERLTPTHTQDKELPRAPTQTTAKRSLLKRSLEIASLEARLDRQRQIYAKRPRIKRLTSLSTKATVDAFYLHSWRRKIETIGNLNYPREARRRKLYGDLRLMVSIFPDGALKEVELLRSSGHRVLDDAAIRIVRLAAPFAPFPDELRQTTDILEIIRTWQFKKNSSLRSY